MTSRNLPNSYRVFNRRIRIKTAGRQHTLSIFCCLMGILLTGCFTETTESSEQSKSPSSAKICNQQIEAEVVALEQIITFNRFGAFNPAGMVYALRKDVVDESGKSISEFSDGDMLKLAGKVRLKENKRPRPLVLRVHEGECLKVKFWNLLSPLPTIQTTFKRADFPDGGIQRQSVQITPPPGASLTDLSTPPRNPELPNSFPLPSQDASDLPTTRSASIHVNGLEYVNIGSDGANVGKNKSSLAEPGKSQTYTWYARQEGGYFMYSAGALAGGEGDGGQLGLGLFGSINVEPKGSIWYRSQVTNKDLVEAADSDNDYSHIDYEDLAIVKDGVIQHSDLNAIIYQTDKTSETPDVCSKRSPGSSCGMSFREFTTIFHDENKVFQAFAELSDEGNPLSAIADGMAINYGASGVGSAVLASKKKIGPAKDCPDCKLEEFFLSSWANGDPAMIVRRNLDGKAVEALYPDDPSNVHHSYLGDPVRFRNIHAGPKETHVFHLHAHQWLQDQNDPNANYLDSQTISPGSSYTYDIQYGGGGNRNLTVGDAIFHCHLYPHFAAGMWELWRNHDVFEDGKPGFFDKQKNPDPRLRNLPDYEIQGGTPNPAIVPIPGLPLAPLATAEFRGYPFFMAGEPGHRPPQPPLDMARDSQGQELNGGLPRHVITQGSIFDKSEPEMQSALLLDEVGGLNQNQAARYIAKRTWKLNNDPNNLAMAAKLKSATIKILPQCGTKDELLAMAFHAGWTKSQIEQMKIGVLPPDMPAYCKDEVVKVLADLDANFTWQLQPEEDKNWPYREIKHDDKNAPMSPLWDAKGYKTAANPSEATNHNSGHLFRINGYAPAQGAPFADPCPSQYYEESTNRGSPVKVNRQNPRIYKSAYIQFDMTVNKYGWHDPQTRMPVLEEDAAATIDGTRLAEPLFFRANSGDCIQFQATNLIPSVLNLDDFQVYTPTDTIGQHIHLVKFDVTSSDGSANGWNYEDGTFSPDEVRERIEASRHLGGSVVDWKENSHAPLALKTYHLPNTPATDPRGQCSDNAKENNELHPWCGAQATIQRWWADPVLNDQWHDRTMRAVFTHDHYGPSSHQQHGFYAALIVEPKDTVWTKIDTSPATTALNAVPCTPKTLGGALTKPCRNDGGPTSYAANIGFPADYPQDKLALHKDEIRREYNLAFADFAILYNADLRPVNPPSRQADLMLPDVVRNGLKPKPEGISTEDPGTRLLNYRNEPIPLRIANEDRKSLEYKQKTITADGIGKGDMANVFSSLVYKTPSNSSSVSERIAKLKINFPDEIVDTAELTSLLSKQKSNTGKFKALLKTNEPWRVDGDPSTPVLASYIGEPLKLHLIQGAQEEQHVFSMTGLKWLAEPESKDSGYMNGQQIGISEHFEFDIPVPSAGTRSTDYWLGSPAVENLWDGMWGLLRSYGFKDSATHYKVAKLARLPEVEPPPFVPGAGLTTCPSFLPDDDSLPENQKHRKEFYVGAWLASDLAKEGRLVYNDRFNITDPNAIVFVEQKKEWIKKQPLDILVLLKDQYKAGKKLEPLILRAKAGECINVHLYNYLPETMVGRDGADVRQSWSNNLMPPIVNGFNFNRVQSSSQIELQPQLLSYDPKQADNQNNIGFNSCKSLSVNEANGELACHDKQVASSLTKPCRATQALTFTNNCKARDFEWYAGDVKFTTQKLPKPFEGAKELNLNDPTRQSATLTEEEFLKTDYYVQPFKNEGKEAFAQYTPIEYGAISLINFGDVIKHSSHGGIAALIVEPRNAILPDSSTLTSQASARIEMPDPKQSFREFVLLFQDDLSLQQNGQPMPNHRMADDAEDTGQKGFNYRTEPLWARNGVGTSGADFNDLNRVDYSDSLSSLKNIAPCIRPCDPKTPVFEAPAGSNVRFRLVHPGGHSRQHAFALYGHNWDYQPWIKHSTQLWDGNGDSGDKTKPLTARVGAIGGIGPSRHLNILTQAGGHCAVPGDYLFRVQEQFQFHGGMWGIFRVGEGQRSPQC